MTREEARHIMKNAAFLATVSDFQAVEEAVDILTADPDEMCKDCKHLDIAAASRLKHLIADINIHEVCSQIEGDNIKNWCRLMRQEIEEVIGVLTIDPEGLIRCKDCKYWYMDADTGAACGFTNMSQPENGYCNWAERIE